MNCTRLYEDCSFPITLWLGQVRHLKPHPVAEELIREFSMGTNLFITTFVTVLGWYLQKEGELLMEAIP